MYASPLSCHTPELPLKQAVSVQDWLTHADVELGAYFPFFKAAGIREVQVIPLTKSLGVFMYLSYTLLLARHPASFSNLPHPAPGKLPWTLPAC